MRDIRKHLPSRCWLGLPFCKGTCHMIGKQTGDCTEKHGCECSSETISAKQFGLCAAESTCRLDCQRRKKESGTCQGWNCVCGDSETRINNPLQRINKTHWFLIQKNMTATTTTIEPPSDRSLRSQCSSFRFNLEILFILFYINVFFNNFNATF